MELSELVSLVKETTINLYKIEKELKIRAEFKPSPFKDLSESDLCLLYTTLSLIGHRADAVSHRVEGTLYRLADHHLL